MSQILIHQIGDHVYVRDVQYEWLPAIVDDVQEHQVLVRIVLPKDWVETTVRRDITDDDDDNNNQSHDDDNDNTDMSHLNKTIDVVDGEQRWVKLVDYYNHHLPLQNWDDNTDENTTGENNVTKGCNDMSKLRYINEAELLYQIKKQYCSLDQPYTRITTTPTDASHNVNHGTTETTTMMIVAVNPCRYIPSLYTIEKQQHYIQFYTPMKQRQHPPSSSFVSSDGT